LFPRSETVYDRQSDRTEKVTAALQTLEQGISGITDSESFKRYLTMMSRFHQYSFGNIALILSQKPDAQQVAGYRTWQALGRYVKKAEKGLAILVPHKVRIEPSEPDADPVYIVKNFGLGYVWDISQTDGKELPKPPTPELLTGESEAGARLYGQLERYATAQGVRVIHRNTGQANGWYAPTRLEIAIHERLAGTEQATKTLAHELAHYTAEHNVFMPQEDAETIAEASAYVVLSHFSIDTSAYSFAYVANWAKDSKVLKRNLAGIQKTATTIISAIEAMDEAHGEQVASPTEISDVAPAGTSDPLPGDRALTLPQPDPARPVMAAVTAAPAGEHIWATSLRPDEPLRKGRGVWAYVRTDGKEQRAYLSASEGWLDVDMTAEACRHAVERTPEGGSLTLHVPIAQRWVTEGLRGPVDKLATERNVSLAWDIYCKSQDGQQPAMERANKIAQLGVAAWRKEGS
jgi:hypothetical protein